MKKAYYNHKWKRNVVNPIDNSDPVLIVKAIPNGIAKWNFYSGKNENQNFVNYITDHQDLKKIDFKKEASKSTKNFEKNFNYVEYMRNPNKKHESESDFEREHIWRYSNHYLLKNKQANTDSRSQKCRMSLIKKEDVYKSIHPKSHIWDIVISEKNKELSDLVFNNQHLIADRILRNLFDFPVDAVISYHGNTDHPHIHIMAYQNKDVPIKNIKRQYKINQKNIYASKKSYLVLLHNNKKYVQELYDLNHKIKNLYNSEVIEKILIKDFLKLNSILNNNFQYAKLSNDQKNEVKKLSMKLLNLKTDDKEILELQEAHTNFVKQCDIFFEKHLSNKSLIDREKSIEQLEKIINESEINFYNMILKTAKSASSYGINNFTKKNINEKIESFTKLLDNKFLSESDKKWLLETIKILEDYNLSNKNKSIYNNKKGISSPSGNKKSLAVLKKHNFYKNFKNDITKEISLKNQLSKLINEINKNKKQQLLN